MRTIQRFFILFLFISVFLVSGNILQSAAAAEFEKDLTLRGITFHVTGINEGGAGRVKITLSGSGVDPGPVENTVDGTVTWAEVTDDLDNDGSPELYVYATCPAGGSPESNQDAYSLPPVAAVVTTGSYADDNEHAAIVVAPGSGQSPSAVVVGPGVIRQENGETVGVVPVFPVQFSEQDTTCIRELKFVLVSTRKGKALKLKSRK